MKAGEILKILTSTIVITNALSKENKDIGKCRKQHNVKKENNEGFF